MGKKYQTQPPYYGKINKYESILKQTVLLPTSRGAIPWQWSGALLSLAPINVLTDKMASENNSGPQDEQTALLETGSEEDVAVQQQSVERKESEMTLYHWTQSFNSQKVSARFSTTEVRTAPCNPAESEIGV